MKKVIGILLGIVMLVSLACAEEMTAEPWQHEGGWVSFAVAMTRDDLGDIWDEVAKVFGESIGFAEMTGDQLKDMTLQGAAATGGVDEMRVEGNRFIGTALDGTELFNHEYTFVETYENKKALGDTTLYVFKTDDKDAGEYTYLLLMEPKKTESEAGSYISFNMFHTQGKYKNLFKGKNVAVPCTMIEKDTPVEGMRAVIERLYLKPAEE